MTGIGNGIHAVQQMLHITCFPEVYFWGAAQSGATPKFYMSSVFSIAISLGTNRITEKNA